MRARGVIILFLTFFVGCGTATIHNFDPADNEAQEAIVFGYIKIFYGRQDVTNGAVVHFDNDHSIKIEHTGFLAAHVVPGRHNIRAITVSMTGTDYSVPNLSIRSGLPGTKTYFGNVALNITPPPPNSPDLSEKWNWSVENHWKEAWQQWNRVFGADKRKFYASMAERLGPDRVQIRKIATDRPEVVPGF